MGLSPQLSKITELVSLKDKAYSAIKEAILSLTLKPRTPLVENELARQLGISKTPIRDALVELEREGLVTKIPFKGTYVTEITLKDIREIFQLRAVLEGFAARLAAPLFSAEELEEMEKTLDAAEAALAQGDIALCNKHRSRFHNFIRNKANNQRLQATIHNLDDQYQRFRPMSYQIKGRPSKSLKEHRKILKALRAQDPLIAEEAMRDHILGNLQDILQYSFSTKLGDIGIWPES
jgi:DNA-binding GntR family transcriptional regulator